MNCPICNKAGLPDYTKIASICPQCNSDLKVFKLLHSIPIPDHPTSVSEKSNNNRLYALIAYCSILLLIAGISITRNITSNKFIVSIEKQNTQLTDSILKLNGKLANVTIYPPEPTQLPARVVIYKVKKGDNLSKIASFFYNDGNNYQQIAEENNLSYPYLLTIGQTLKIKLKN